MSFDFKPSPKPSTTQPSVSLPEPELVSPNDVALPYERPNWFSTVLHRDERTPEERAIAEVCTAAKVQKDIIERYIGWKIRFEDIAIRNGQSGEMYAPNHWGIATSHLYDAREEFNRWCKDALRADVNISDVLAQVYAPVNVTGLDAEIKRLARVFVGLESARPLDNRYFDL